MLLNTKKWKSEAPPFFLFGEMPNIFDCTELLDHKGSN